MQLEPFSTGPEEKGIETRMRAPKPSLPVRSALALKKKGLRLPFSNIILSVFRSALALKKKGLRRELKKVVIHCLDFGFSTGPEEKGIETANGGVTP